MLAPATPGLHRVELRAVDRELEVAPGLREIRWTFGGVEPAPILHGRVGDIFEITLINDATMGHGIDFHAGALAPDQPMRTLEPGSGWSTGSPRGGPAPGCITAVHLR